MCTLLYERRRFKTHQNVFGYVSSFEKRKSVTGIAVVFRREKTVVHFGYSKHLNWGEHREPARGEVAGITCPLIEE